MLSVPRWVLRYINIDVCVYIHCTQIHVCMHVLYVHVTFAAHPFTQLALVEHCTGHLQSMRAVDKFKPTSRQLTPQFRKQRVLQAHTWGPCPGLGEKKTRSEVARDSEEREQNMAELEESGKPKLKYLPAQNWEGKECKVWEKGGRTRRMDTQARTTLKEIETIKEF